VNVLALGGADARTLGVRQELTWLVVVAAATLMTAAVVSISGLIGWVGLLVPHVARMVVGARFPDMLPASALMGAGFLLAVDTVARNVSYGDLPLGALTAIIGAPFFLTLLVRTYQGVR
jgi:iron complex transport system permease protein